MFLLPNLTVFDNSKRTMQRQDDFYEKFLIFVDLILSPVSLYAHLGTWGLLQSHCPAISVPSLRNYDFLTTSEDLSTIISNEPYHTKKVGGVTQPTSAGYTITPPAVYSLEG